MGLRGRLDQYGSGGRKGDGYGLRPPRDRKKSHVAAIPNANPPTCAQKAIPPPTCVPISPRPLNSCSTNQVTNTTAAGSSTKVMKKKITSVWIRAVGKRIRYAPRIDAMA